MLNCLSTAMQFQHQLHIDYWFLKESSATVPLEMTFGSGSGVKSLYKRYCDKCKFPEGSDDLSINTTEFRIQLKSSQRFATNIQIHHIIILSLSFWLTARLRGKVILAFMILACRCSQFKQRAGCLESRLSSADCQ